MFVVRAISEVSDDFRWYLVATDDRSQAKELIERDAGNHFDDEYDIDVYDMDDEEVEYLLDDVTTYPEKDQFECFYYGS